MISANLRLLELNTGKKSRVVTALRMAKQHLFNYQASKGIWGSFAVFVLWRDQHIILRVSGLRGRVPGDRWCRSDRLASLRVFGERYEHGQAVRVRGASLLCIPTDEFLGFRQLRGCLGAREGLPLRSRCRGSEEAHRCRASGRYARRQRFGQLVQPRVDQRGEDGLRVCFTVFLKGFHFRGPFVPDFCKRTSEIELDYTFKSGSTAVRSSSHYDFNKSLGAETEDDCLRDRGEDGHSAVKGA